VHEHVLSPLPLSLPLPLPQLDARTVAKTKLLRMFLCMVSLPKWLDQRSTQWAMLPEFIVMLAALLADPNVLPCESEPDVCGANAPLTDSETPVSCL